MSESRRRVSFTQLLHLWEYLNKHRDFSRGANKSAQARDQSKRMWERCAEILNSVGEGAIKSGPEWSKYWVDMKAKIKRKNRLINDSRKKTGGGPAADMELSEIEKKFLSLLGDDYGSGLPGVQVDPQISQGYEDNPAGPSSSYTTQSTITDEPIYLAIGSSEECQQNEPNMIVASAASLLSPIGHDLINPADLQLSPSRQGTTRLSPRRRLVLEADPPQSARQDTIVQVPSRRRRRQRPVLSASEARERLVLASEKRAQAELDNSQTLKSGVELLGEIVSILKQQQAG